MSYINLEILKSRDLSLLELSVLQLGKQAKLEEMAEVLSENSETVDALLKKGFLELIKGKKGDSKFQRVRATKYGIDTLELVGTPLVTDGDIQMYNYLCTMYLEEDSTRALGNRKAGLRYCAEFRQIMGFTLHEMYWLCYMFVANTHFTKVLEYIFFDRKKNPYGKFKDNLDDSKIYLFWMDNEYEIREFWKQKIKQD